MTLTIDDRIKEIEEEIRKTPYHKATEHHIGKLKARIARLREEKIEKLSKKGGGGGGFFVKKTGDASVVLVGPPSVGKSTLLNRLTNAESKIGAYDFTTTDIVPGMMDYKGAKIQIFDVPGILSGAASGKGKGKEVLSAARNADLILVMVDVKTINLIPSLMEELHEAGIRLNEERPKVNIIKKLEGGIKVNATSQLSLTYETIKSLAAEFRIANAEVIIKEDISLDRLIDAFMGNRAYLPYLTVVNKADLGVPDNLAWIIPTEHNPVIISAHDQKNLELLKEKIWDKLKFIRIYLKKENVDKNEPFIMKKEQTLSCLLEQISICNKETFSKAKIYGPGAKFFGQEVSLSFVPQDESIVQFLS